jgi:hypothetical protein
MACPSLYTDSFTFTVFLFAVTLNIPSQTAVTKSSTVTDFFSFFIQKHATFQEMGLLP